MGQRRNSLFVQLLVPTSSTMSRNLLVKYLNGRTIFDLCLSTKNPKFKLRSTKERIGDWAEDFGCVTL